MDDLPESLFANPVWHALRTKHRHLALSAGDACRYAADVAPFAAVEAPTRAALEGLHSLLEAGEAVWVFGENWPSMAGLFCEGTLDCLQMVLPESVAPPPPAIDLDQLFAPHAGEMMALTNLAFPGFFRDRTCDMGAYYGVRSGGELIAMGGERLMLDGYSEISGVCTHPSHRGKGLARGLIWHLARNHRRDGLVSWLHVGADNHHAVELYLRLGFRTVRKVTIHRISRQISRMATVREPSAASVRPGLPGQPAR
jgi:ribosomal protein S18 acetylase RimI-like enzyme